MVADLIVVGAGAKAAAVAAKVHAVNTLGLGPIALTIIEALEPGASWKGVNGMTSGEEPLAITPTKDVGFPYESGHTFGDVGKQIDRAMLPFSWQHYLVLCGGFARWVNAGAPAIRHLDYGEYLTWVLSRATAGVRLVQGRAEQVAPDGDSWAINVAGEAGPRTYRSGALMLTGPGVHRHLPHDPAAAARMLHCDSKRGDFARIADGGSPAIAIVGGGESALSCVVYLRRFRPNARLTVYTPTLPMSRGESFLENRVFSNPDVVDWSALDVATRRTFIKQCDRGVFDAGSLLDIAYDDHCRFLAGRVVAVASEADGDRVTVHYASPRGSRAASYDYVVNCTGFDLLQQLRNLFSVAARTSLESYLGRWENGQRDGEVPIGRSLEVAGLRPRLHIPGLAALSQGPGFANLGCLGLLADRVLEPLIDAVSSA